MMCIKVEPVWPNAHFGLALCCIRLEENATAVHHIEQAIE